ncbi:hypothetical protein FGF1_03750 [Flavobacteriaceae bacterium GF1]
MTPTYNEFYGYFEKCMVEKDDEAKNYTEWIKDKYEAWKLNGWKKSKTKGQKEILIPILNWKSTLRQCLGYRIPNKVRNIKVVTDPTPKKRGKVDSIDDEIIISAWNHYSIQQNLELRHDECFDILYQRGVFKPASTKWKDGTWQDFYERMKLKAVKLAVYYSIDKKWKPEDRERIKRGEDPIVERFMKLEVLKVYFEKFENEDRLKKSLNDQ